MNRSILTLSCADRPGIVHSVSGALLEAGGNILENAQFGDTGTGLFALRTRFESDRTAAEVSDMIAPVVERFDARWTLRDEDRPHRVMIMVSRYDHCLVDLLYRRRTGELPVEIPLIVSNHTDCAHHAARDGVRYEHLPVTAAIRDQQEGRLLELVEEERIDFVVLARYMQVLSPRVCEALPSRIINIHHSFLPGFKGARPYHQAHARGVKLIGATAHYVTPDLDEGPIIEQDVERVDHSMSPERLVEMGRDVERRVLARAVKYQAEDRIVLDGHKTIVFR